LKAAFAIAILDLISQAALLIHLKASAKERFKYCHYIYIYILYIYTYICLIVATRFDVIRPSSGH